MRSTTNGCSARAVCARSRRPPLTWPVSLILHTRDGRLANRPASRVELLPLAGVLVPLACPPTKVSSTSTGPCERCVAVFIPGLADAVREMPRASSASTPRSRCSFRLETGPSVRSSSGRWRAPIPGAPRLDCSASRCRCAHEKNLRQPRQRCVIVLRAASPDAGCSSPSQCGQRATIRPPGAGRSIRSAAASSGNIRRNSTRVKPFSVSACPVPGARCPVRRLHRLPSIWKNCNQGGRCQDGMVTIVCSPPKERLGDRVLPADVPDAARSPRRAASTISIFCCAEQLRFFLCSLNPSSPPVERPMLSRTPDTPSGATRLQDRPTSQPSQLSTHRQGAGQPAGCTSPRVQ